MEIKIQQESGKELSGFLIKPTSKASKVLLLIHGLGEHSSRYEEWASKFASEGIAVLAVDLPGHGKSPGRKGHIDSYHDYNIIVEKMYDMAASEFPGSKIGLYGHSLGGNIALNYLLTNLAGIDFAINTSPWLILGDKPSGIKMALARTLNHLLPGLLLSNGLNRNHISHVAEVTERYSEDPLVHDRVSVRLGVLASDAAERIMESGSLIDIPVLIAHGSEDKICSPEGSALFSDGNDNIHLKIFTGGYHEIHNESFKDEVFSYIVEWLNKIA